MDRIAKIKKVEVAPKCGLPCSRPVDPKRHVGALRLKNRTFEWFACPSHRCCQITEWPERKASATDFEADREMMAIEILAEILQGERPWKDLVLVDQLMPEAQ